MAETTTRQALREAASSDLKLRFRGTASGSSGDKVTVADFSDLWSEAMAPLAAYLTPEASVAFRRIVDFDPGSGLVTLNRDSVANGAVDLHLILTPVDWNELIDLALRSLYFVDRTEETPLTGVSSYTLTATWIQTVQQIERVIFQSESGTPIWTDEDDAGSFKKIQDANAVTLLFGYMPDTLTGLKIIVEARHFYEVLANDAATTTCPVQLARAAVKVEALRRVWHILGEKDAKAQFGQEMTQAELRLLDEKRLHVQQSNPSPLHVEGAKPGPEMAMGSSGYRW